MKKYVSIAGILLIVVVSFAAGLLVSNKMGPAALSVPFLTNNTPLLAHTCVDQKCVAVSNQCSVDVNCQTHMQCNTQKQCVVASGPGTNQCSVDLDCNPIKDPQAWCQTNNASPGMKTTAVKYPNGNFSCDCYYLNKDGTHSQATCRNSHLQ